MPLAMVFCHHILAKYYKFFFPWQRQALTLTTPFLTIAGKDLGISVCDIPSIIMTAAVFFLQKKRVRGGYLYSTRLKIEEACSICDTDTEP